jgi:uncharacterized tellurite resistance protein B-like protein
LSLLRFLGIGVSTERRDDPESLLEIEARLEVLPAEEARFISAFAYLLARIAGVDLRTESVERDVIAQRLEDFAEIDTALSVLLTETAIHAASSYSATDDHLVARAFRDMSGRAERLKLLRCLFAVAAADDSITTKEDNEIFEIAEAIGVDHSDVIGLRSNYKELLASMKPLRGER